MSVSYFYRVATTTPFLNFFTVPSKLKTPVPANLGIYNNCVAAFF